MGEGGVHDTQSKHQRFVSYHIRREYQRGKLHQCVLSVTLKTCAPAAICYAGLARGMNHKKHKGQKSDLCLLKVLQFLTVIVAHLTGGPHPLQRREWVLSLSGHVAKSTHVHLVTRGWVGADAADTYCRVHRLATWGWVGADAAEASSSS